MSFENMLANADPEDAAEAANIIARAFVNDPSASEEVRAAAAKILDLSLEELTQRLREARERETVSANDDIGAAHSSQT
jgi:hypothetical protein